jgi:hypothetical protein
MLEFYIENKVKTFNPIMRLTFDFYILFNYEINYEIRQQISN